MFVIQPSVSHGSTRLRYRQSLFAVLVLPVLISSFGTKLAIGDEPEHVLHTFRRIQLTDTYYSEGANFGDINQDGQPDAVYGPYWFAGPEFTEKHEVYPPVPQPREGYAAHFFSWVRDFNGDRQPDLFVVGFPGTPAYVYENPGPNGRHQHWTKHEVFDWVSNESPYFGQFVGDELPELVCSRDGFFGYAVPDVQQPWKPWTFHRISPQVTDARFGHGLGVGDVDLDGRMDLLTKDGWYQQPASLTGDPPWTFHPFEFSAAGGAEMYAYDVDGDGDQDVITSLEAHAYGLAWFEQARDGDKITFRKHLIMGNTPESNKYGVLFTELHSLNLVDIDGDGLKDIVTGKTYWSHHQQSPLWDAGAVVYWFKLVRNADGVDWIPHQADGEAGIGRQLTVGNANNDPLPDIVVGGMKGAHVLVHAREKVSPLSYLKAQPTPLSTLAAGLTPEQAAAKMTVPEGFHVQLAAGEPTVHQPVAFTIDQRGRLWVAEAHTYPIRAPEGEGKDRIIILEDTDQDGTLDKSTTFAEGLNLVSGLEVGFGGVWIGAAPYLMFIPDANGDDRPDGEPRILLDGFGYHDTHETLNAFIWGPDGWLYGCHGVFTHSLVGKPGTSDSERIPMNAGVWRYHPTRHTFEVFAWGTSNPWGVDFNDHGHAFITACVIPHLYHVIQGARYQRQGGTHFNPYDFDDIKTIADHLHYAGNIQDHAWWGAEPLIQPSTSAAGGGHAHCGAMIYLGDNWPREYRNALYFNNIHGNRVNCDILERSGSGYVGHHGPDLLKANDHWYRGINLRSGPDGSVYLIDWYDRNACHRTNPEIWDRTNGRIYRVRYGDVKPMEVDLGKLTDGDLIRLQSHDNEWHVRTARRILQERVAAGKENNFMRLELSRLLTQDSPTKRLRGLWALHAVGGLSESQLAEILKDADENVRAWGIQLVMEQPRVYRRFLTFMLQAARNEDSALVRLYLASALQRMEFADRWVVAEALLQHQVDADDHNVPLMIWYGVEPLVKQQVGRALKLVRSSQIPLVSQFILRRAAAEDRLIPELLRDLPTASAQQQATTLEAMLQAFEGRVDIPMPEEWKPAYDQLSQSPEPSTRDLADRVAVLMGDQRIFPKLRAQLVDPQAELSTRREALNILVRGRDAAASPSLRQVLDVPELRGAALRALASYDDGEVVKSILSHYGQLTTEERQDAINTLTARPSSALALMDAIESQRVAATDVHAYTIRQLLGFSDPVLTNRIKSVWGAVREATTDKKRRINELKKQLTPETLQEANLGHGRATFNKTCASCHRLFGEGGTVGPDITGSNRANLDYLLENAVDPSAVLGKDYRMSVITTEDGRVITGLVLSETESGVTVRTVNDTIVIAKREIEQRDMSELSLMPEGLLDQLRVDDIRDLVAYLASPTQVSLRGPESVLDESTGKVGGAWEGETLKIVGKTAGTVQSQGMSNFTKDHWSGSDQLWWTGGQVGDRLDVELPVDDAGTQSVEIVLTRAPDYAVVQLTIDGHPLGGPLDLYQADEVVTTGVLTFSDVPLKVGSRLSVEILGAHPQAIKSYMVGIDYVRVVASEVKKDK